jgi:cell division GTPase FtsZ
MKRRDVIMGLAGMGILPFIPVKLFSNTHQIVPCHFIGLGGGGTQMFFHFLRHEVEGKFTAIDSLEGEDLIHEGVDFIPYNPDEPNGLPNKLNALFNKNERFVLLAGIGGVTGTTLMDYLLHWLPANQYKAICTLPFAFEGPKRQKVGSTFYEKYKSRREIQFFDMDAFGKANGKIKMKEAFRKVDEEVMGMFKDYFHNNFTFHL